ncbi:MAG: acyltransferase [Methanoregula sp.]|uniref:acyltransferase n=1 Tax=Methanoregula sp. TaxID=2052170 RepID=UPI003BB12DAB
MIEYGINKKGARLQVFEPVTLGFPSREFIGKSEFSGTTIGNDAILRSGTIIYCDVTIGNRFQAGHNVLIREKTRIGDHVSVGTGVIIEGNTILGDEVNLQSMVYIPTNTVIKDHVFIGPNAVLTNDRYPPSGIGGLVAPIIENHAAIGANSTILPGIHIGEGALVAAGAIVTRDVPPHKLAVGAPAKIRDLPSALIKKNSEN